MHRGVLILLVCAAALGGFVVGRFTAPVSPPPREETVLPLRPGPNPIGGRGLELARLKRLAVRVTADDMVAGARGDVDATLRNRLATAGFQVVAETEDHDALIQARVEGFHFSAFDEFGAGSELHVVGVHAVEVDGVVRMIPHDIWQADAMRLARRDRLNAEALSLTEELLQHLLGAIERSRTPR